MPKIFACNFEGCQQAFNKKSHLRKHLQEHIDPSKILHCSACTYTTIYAQCLVAHRNCHTNSLPYHCPQASCTFRANDRSGLLRHRKVEHGYQTRQRRPRVLGNGDGPSHPPPTGPSGSELGPPPTPVGHSSLHTSASTLMPQEYSGEGIGSTSQITLTDGQCVAVDNQNNSVPSWSFGAFQSTVPAGSISSPHASAPSFLTPEYYNGGVGATSEFTSGNLQSATEEDHRVRSWIVQSAIPSQTADASSSFLPRAFTPHFQPQEHYGENVGHTSEITLGNWQLTTNSFPSAPSVSPQEYNGENISSIPEAAMNDSQHAVDNNDNSVQPWSFEALEFTVPPQTEGGNTSLHASTHPIPQNEYCGANVGSRITAGDNYSLQAWPSEALHPADDNSRFNATNECNNDLTHQNLPSGSSADPYSYAGVLPAPSAYPSANELYPISAYDQWWNNNSGAFTWMNYRRPHFSSDIDAVSHCAVDGSPGATRQELLEEIEPHMGSSISSPQPSVCAESPPSHKPEVGDSECTASPETLVGDTEPNGNEPSSKLAGTDENTPISLFEDGTSDNAGTCQHFNDLTELLENFNDEYKFSDDFDKFVSDLERESAKYFPIELDEEDQVDLGIKG